MDKTGLKKLRRQPPSRSERAHRLNPEQAKRKTERVASFYEYEDRNQEIGERAQKLIDETRHQSPDEHRSATIVLDKPTVDDRNRIWILGNVQRIEEEAYNNSLGHYYKTGRLSYRFTFIVSDEHWGDGAFKGQEEESTYDLIDPQRTQYGYPQNDIRTEAERLSSPHLFSPVSALKRYLLARSMDERLSGLEATIALFEESAADQRLNPGLAPKAEAAQVA